VKLKTKLGFAFALSAVFGLSSSTTLRAQSNKILVLDGSTQYMTVASSAALNVESGQSRTITFKVKSTSTVNDARYFAKRAAANGVDQSNPGTGGTGYEAFYNGGRVGPNAKTTDGGGVGGAFNTVTTMSNGNWHHVVMIFDHSTVSGKYYTRLSVDGTVTASSEANAASLANLVEFVVGAASDYSRKFAGSLDDIRVYNKVLNIAEIEADKNLEAVDNTTPNLVAAWDFENVSGVTVPDVSGNGNTGTLVGNPSIQIVQTTMIYSAASVIQTNIPIGRGDTDNRIIAVKVTTDGFRSPVSLSDLRFTMNGTSNLSDVSKIKVYATGNSKRFATGNVFATDINPAAGVITASGVQQLLPGDNYFWISYDVKSTAAEGNLLDASCEEVVVGGTTYVLGTKTATGASTVLLTHKLLFKPGDAGAYTYRIPAIVTANDGSLVTAIDKRVARNNDLASDIDILIRRSTDNGQTWSPALTIADLGSTNSDGASDPALVVDKASGKIICLFATNNGLMASNPSNLIRIGMCTSSDNGVTWTAPVDITNQIYGPACSNPISSTWYAAWIASGRAHQLRNGRIVAAMGVRQTSATKIDNFMVYSDDAGVTWQTSTNIACNNGDEAKIVELNDGKLVMSIRSGGSRRFVESTDKGITWGTPYNKPTILDPACNGDFIRYTSTIDGYDKNRLIHTVPYVSSSPRRNISVLLSYDEGQTWPVRKTLYLGNGDYSSITMLPDGTLGVYYENQDDQIYNMYFARFTLSWLTDGADTFVPSPLPLKLVHFGANFQQSSSQINATWQTQNEVNVDHFELESSTDGKSFEKIAVVKAKANDLPGTFNYQTSFKPAQSGTLYLRLKTVDLNGSFAYSKIISVEIASHLGLRLSPNPVKDILQVQLAGDGAEAQVQLLDAQGKLLKTVSTQQANTTLGFLSYPKGIYFVKVKSTSGWSTQKVVKN
jgi:hypothetical protein